MVKKMLIVIFAGILLGAGPVTAISITDYKVPEGGATSLFGGFDYSYASDTSGAKSADNGSITTDFYRFYSSLPFGYKLGFNGIATRNGLSFYTLSVDTLVDTLTNDTAYSVSLDTTTAYTYNLSALAQIDKYIFKDLFGYGRTDLAMATGYDMPSMDVSLGIGWGRFINATPLARAVRVNDELRREGILTADLFDATLVDLGMMMAPEVIDEYEQQYDYWQRYYYSDVEQLLKGSGKLRDDELGAVGGIVLDDVFTEHISDRYYGYEVSAGVGYEVLVPYENVERDAFVKLNINSAYPFGLRSQFVEFASIQTPFDAFGSEFSFSFAPSFSYEVSNNLDVIVAYLLTGNQPDGGDLQASHDVNLTAAYYVVNRLIFTNSLGLTRPAGASSMGFSFSTGLTYRAF